MENKPYANGKKPTEIDIITYGIKREQSNNGYIRNKHINKYLISVKKQQ